MKKEITLIVVGLSHYMDDYDDFCRNLTAGSFVFVQHEMGNMYDKHALYVMMPDGRTVGHIGRDFSAQLHAAVGEKMVVARVVDGEHKAFRVALMVDADKYDGAEGSTDSNEIVSQLPEGVVGLRNVLPLLPADRAMEQAWTMIEMGQESGDMELTKDGVKLFAKHYSCSLCVEDQKRAQWICDNGLDEDDMIQDRRKELSYHEQKHNRLLNQIQAMKTADKGVLAAFRQRYNEACTGDAVVKHWLDTVLDGQLKGCYDELTLDMSAFVLYHKLSRADLYILLSHLIALSKPENDHADATEEPLFTDKDAQIKALIIDRLMRIQPYLRNMDREQFEPKLNELFNIEKQDNHTAGRIALWTLFTKKFPRDNKTKDGYDRIVLLNLVGYMKQNGYFCDSENFLAQLIFESGNIDSDGNNIGRAFDAQRYTPEITSAVEHYFS